MTQHSVARAYSIMQEAQELQDKARKLSERNAELAKALTLAKQELTKARTAQNAVFSEKVLEWMEARCKPIEVQHTAVQCSFEEPEQMSEKCRQEEPDPAFSPVHRVDGAMTVYARSRRTSSAVDSVTCELGLIRCKQDEDTDSLVLHECRANKNHDGSVECEAIDDRARSRKAAEPSTCMNNSTARDRVESLARQHQQTYSSPVTSCSSSSRTKAALTKRLRQRGATVSYIEPKLNTKLRRGDYYGLGKPTMQSNKHRRRPKHCAGADARCTGAALRSPSFNQQFSPFHRRRAMRSVTRGVSYAEPKLNTKLRRGDKFTFTT